MDTIFIFTIGLFTLIMAGALAAKSAKLEEEGKDGDGYLVLSFIIPTCTLVLAPFALITLF